MADDPQDELVLEFGGDPADVLVDDDDDMPPPPAAPARGGYVERPAPPPAAMTALGPPPENALEAAKWAYRLLMMQAYTTMNRAMPESERDRVVRQILRDAAKHMTDAVRYDYLQMVEQDKKELEARKKGAASAELTPRRQAGDAAKIIPLRRDG